MNKEKAIQSLTKAIGGARNVYSSYYRSAPFDKWLRNTRLAIGHIFGEMSQHMQEFNDIKFVDSSGRSSELTYRIDVGRAQALLESMRDEVQDYWPDEEVTVLEPSVIANNVSSAESVKNSCVFIGHGRSKLWARLKIFLEDDLGLDTVVYESESRVGESIIPVLEKMLAQATFAAVVLTAEDETAEGQRRARQNVIHEVGLFQGRLGFKKVVLVRQEGLEDFSNVAGLQYIGFREDRIEESFYELQRVLKREGML